MEILLTDKYFSTKSVDIEIKNPTFKVTNLQIAAIEHYVGILDFDADWAAGNFNKANYPCKDIACNDVCANTQAMQISGVSGNQLGLSRMVANGIPVPATNKLSIPYNTFSVARGNGFISDGKNLLYVISADNFDEYYADYQANGLKATVKYQKQIFQVWFTTAKDKFTLPCVSAGTVVTRRGKR